MTKLYNDYTKLDNFTMSVKSGILFGFLGPNGAGKITTIMLLLGLVEPTERDVSVLGHNIRKEAQR